MKKKLFLHMGHGKTGTTSIQHFLANLFSDSIVYYPQTCRGKAHGRYSSLQHLELHSSGWDSRLCKYQRGEDEKMLDDLRDEISKTNKKYIILSSECGLATFGAASPSYSTQDLFFRELNENFDFKIVYYVRNQFDALRSHYCGNIAPKSNSLQDYCRFIEHIKKNKYIQFNYWRNVVKYWARVCGEDKILVRLYHPQVMKNSDVVEDFLETVGLYKELWTADVNTQRRNVSTGIHSLKHKTLPPHTHALIRDFFVEDNIKLAERFLSKEDASYFMEGF